MLTLEKSPIYTLIYSRQPWQRGIARAMRHPGLPYLRQHYLAWLVWTITHFSSLLFLSFLPIIWYNHRVSCTLGKGPLHIKKVESDIEPYRLGVLQFPLPPPTRRPGPRHPTSVACRWRKRPTDCLRWYNPCFLLSNRSVSNSNGASSLEVSQSTLH